MPVKEASWSHLRLRAQATRTLRGPRRSARCGDSRGHRRNSSDSLRGLAEGMMLAAIRKAGVPLQRIRPALDRLRGTFGLEHGLASRSLPLHRRRRGAVRLRRAGRRHARGTQCPRARRLRKGQHVFASVIDEYLQRAVRRRRLRRADSPAEIWRCRCRPGSATRLRSADPSPTGSKA